LGRGLLGGMAACPPSVSATGTRYGHSYNEKRIGTRLRSFHAQCMRVTDRRTDRKTDRRTDGNVISIAERLVRNAH